MTLTRSHDGMLPLLRIERPHLATPKTQHNGLCQMHNVRVL
jgi:hypothetical protein